MGTWRAASPGGGEACGAGSGALRGSGHGVGRASDASDAAEALHLGGEGGIRRRSRVPVTVFSRRQTAGGPQASRRQGGAAAPSVTDASRQNANGGAGGHATVLSQRGGDGGAGAQPAWAGGDASLSEDGCDGCDGWGEGGCLTPLANAVALRPDWPLGAASPALSPVAGAGAGAGAGALSAGSALNADSALNAGLGGGQVALAQGPPCLSRPRARVCLTPTQPAAARRSPARSDLRDASGPQSSTGSGGPQSSTGSRGPQSSTGSGGPQSSTGSVSAVAQRADKPAGDMTKPYSLN